MSDTVLVTGAGGQFGRLAVDHLLATFGGTVVAGTRDPARLADLASRGIAVRRVDFDDEGSLEDAFAGIDRVLLISTDVLDRPGRRLAQHRAAVAAASAAGVGHVVYTSMPNPGPGSPVVFASDHFGTEEAIRQSGLSHTILRVSWYQENLAASLPAILGSKTWYTAAGAGKVAHVARADAARAAAAAIAAVGPSGETLDVTGGAALTTAEIAALIGEVFATPIAVVDVSDDGLAAGLTAAGLPPFLIPVVVSFDRNTREGRMPAPTDTVERLTGRAPRPLRAYLEEARAAMAL